MRERERVQQRGGSWAYDRLNSILEVSRAFGAGRRRTHARAHTHARTKSHARTHPRARAVARTALFPYAPAAVLDGEYRRQAHYCLHYY